MEPKLVQLGNHGMFQDISISKSSNEFAFENRNIRITAVNDTTALSITNEKGPKPVILRGGELKGTYLGHCIIGKFIVIFTKDGNNDYIYRLDKGSAYIECPSETYVDELSDVSTTMEVVTNDRWSSDIGDEEVSTNTEISEAFNIVTLWGNGSLGFDLNYPIETTGYYESEDIQKVYWIDGINSPRFINIVDKTPKTLASQFDFVSTVTGFPNVTIEKEYSGNGIFPSGVIQYFITYYNKFGSETSILYASDLQYITFLDRGGKADETISCNFKLTVSQIDKSFDYIRVYSAKRTSLDAQPEVQIVKDVPIPKGDTNTVVINDNNLNQATIDSNLLYYLGGEDFIASTLDQKDNTLFLGNLKLKNTKLPDTISWNLTLSDAYADVGSATNQFYSYDYQLGKKSSGRIKYFKAGETYRFAIQFLDKKGKWSPIECLGDKEIPLNLRPYESNGRINIPKLVYSGTYWKDINNKDSNWIGYRILRAETSAATRRTLAQGVLCPTVFNYGDRIKNTPYSINSWIMRTPQSGRYWHFDNLSDEIQCNEDKGLNDINNDNKPYYIAIVANVKNNMGWGSSYIEVRYFEIQNSNDNLDTWSSQDANLVWSEILKTTADYDKAVNEALRNKGYSFTLGTGDFQRKYSGNEINGLRDNQDYNRFVYSWAGWPSKSSYNDAWRCYVSSDTIATAHFDVNSQYYIDESIVTFHSPEIDTVRQIANGAEGINCRIIGVAPFQQSRQDSVIQIDESFVSGAETLPITDVIKTPSKTLTNENLYKDGVPVVVEDDGTISNITAIPGGTYTMYMWHKSGSVVGINSKVSQYLENIGIKDINVAELKHKIFATERYSRNSLFIDETNYFDIKDSSESVQTFNSSEITTLPIDVDVKENESSTVYYYGNYDNIVTTTSGYSVDVYLQEGLKDDKKLVTDYDIFKLYDPVHIKFSSTQHAVFSLKWDTLGKVTLPWIIENEDWENQWTKVGDIYKYNKTDFEWNHNLQYIKPRLSVSEDVYKTVEDYPYVFIAELYRDLDKPYGDNIQDVNETLKWIPCSPVAEIGTGITLEGDTYYQRWDCIKTYPTTESDTNSVVDITSFMVESHLNLDGRCDINRGGTKLTSYRPDLNFNIFNNVYSQEDNLFEYNILDEKYNLDTFSNQVVWSLTKLPTDDIDTWTSISFLNLLGFDGTYGPINKIITVNNSLMVFQDRAISTINYNDRIQISTEQNTPIEVQNSGKVTGYTYVSKSLGCKNKWAICQASSGVYFIESDRKALYGINSEGLVDYTAKCGLSTWFKKNTNSVVWNPNWASVNSVKLSYDGITNDLYTITKNECVAFNEGLTAFTSFMPYEGIPLIFHFDGNSYLLSQSSGRANITLNKMFAGNYNRDVNGNFIDYSIDYRVNPEPLEDKTFTNIEYLADCLEPEESVETQNVYTDNNYPFNKLEVWNEYQYGSVDLPEEESYLPQDQTKKFRVWRANIPRNQSDDNLYGLDRIRNPWVHLKLSKHFDTDNGDFNKMIFHSLLVKYYK